VCEPVALVLKPMLQCIAAAGRGHPPLPAPVQTGYTGKPDAKLQQQASAPNEQDCEQYHAVHQVPELQQQASITNEQGCGQRPHLATSSLTGWCRRRRRWGSCASSLKLCSCSEGRPGTSGRSSMRPPCRCEQHGGRGSSQAGAGRGCRQAHTLTQGASCFVYFDRVI